jgi:hypothetical protein
MERNESKGAQRPPNPLPVTFQGSASSSKVLQLLQELLIAGVQESSALVSIYRGLHQSTELKVHRNAKERLLIVNDVQKLTLLTLFPLGRWRQIVEARAAVWKLE